MNGSITALDAVGALYAGGASYVRANRALFALTVSLFAGVAALIAPPLALLVLAALIINVLLRSEPHRVNIARIAGPLFAALIVGALVGIAGGIGVLFVWRLYEDTLWSTREAARLAAAAGRPVQTTRASLAHAWLTPLYGLTLVAYTAPHMIAGLPLDLPHVPMFVPLTVGVLALLGVSDWMLRRAADWRLGELAAAPATHLLTHHVLFAFAFGMMIDVSAGLVALFAWRLVHATPIKAQA